MARRGTKRGEAWAGGAAEWIGGRLPAPFYVTEGEPVRPDIVLWFELPAGLVVGAEVVPPDTPLEVVGDVLARAMEQPMEGPPRRPAQIRISDPRLIEVVAPLVGDRHRVRLAPTPELDELIAGLAEEMGDPGAGAEVEPSYFEDGRVSEPVLAELFTAAERLYRQAPWQYDVDFVLRVDVPPLAVEGACLSVMGHFGEAFGFLLFPSVRAFDDFIAATEEAEGEPVPFGTEVLALEFERGADLPATMRREVSEHRWPVAGPAAYPVVTCRDADGLVRPLTERDVRLVTDVADALSAFCKRNGGQLPDTTRGPVMEEYFSDAGGIVRFSVPHDAFEDVFDLRPRAQRFAPPPRPVAALPSVGRNDPCPCGSGRKYKKCHLGKPLSDADDAASVGDAAVAGDVGDGLTDRQRVIGAIINFAVPRFGATWVRSLRAVQDHPELLADLATIWWVFHATAEGRALAAHYLEAGADRLPADLQAWIRSQLAAWLSLWEVVAVEPGGPLELADLLTGERRTVIDRISSQMLRPRAVILTRVVDHDGTSTLWGTAPHSLPPLAADKVVQRVRRRLGIRTGPVPVERLREMEIGADLICHWQKTVDALFERAATPPRLQNTSGDPLLLTSDHFSVAPGAHADVARALESCGATPGTRAGDFLFLAAGERPDDAGTVTATARLTDDRLTVETNSLARADGHRARVEAACGALIRHRMREHSDPQAALTHGAPTAAEPAVSDPAEAARLERELKEQYYAQWLDEAIPALGGKTPRAAVRTAAGRRKVDLLLRDMEHHESVLPADRQMDFSIVRRALGLET